MTDQDEKGLRWNSVGVADGSVNIWMVPLWLKGDRVVRAVVSPKTARSLAIKLLQAADAAEGQP
jgi:hypothetical protein